MAPRTILHTGKGGAGRTAVAAATARRCAAAGHRTLLLGADPSHGIGPALGQEPGPDPQQAGDLLWVQEVRAQEELERRWAGARWLEALLAARGVPPVSAEELTAPPGFDALFALLVLKRHHDGRDFDVVVVDGPPTGAALRLLALPDQTRWWLARLAPRQGPVLHAAQRLVRDLIAMNEVLGDHDRASVRLVTTADPEAVDEARDASTSLSLHGVLCDALVVNRVLGDDAGPLFDDLRARQREGLAAARASFAPAPVLEVPWLAAQPRGDAGLDALAEAVFGERDPAAVLHRGEGQSLEVGPERATLRLALPFARQDEISLKRHGTDLVVRVAGHKRTLSLPPALEDYRPAGARFDDGALTVTFDRLPATA
ncbi:ArsA family ATPase [Conexibacter sp. SYSU D00693]|uniref:ArsA family ATPase n=1 Tax=Conexibacter sp. SYSU D00693 TaxID=2812560 RepID=UPI00196AA09C|nr:ArsA family ATPase [Conexibacter sp. SYSU D00693]